MDDSLFRGGRLANPSDPGKQAQETLSDTRSPASPTNSRRTNTTSDGSTATTSSSAPETTAQMAPKADAPPPEVLPQLTEPSDDEAAHYYEWLPSQPVLVGRSTSGTRHWGPDNAVHRAGGYAGNEGKQTKSMWVGPVGDHSLRNVWPDPKFRHKLKHAMATLGGVDFHSITPARVGLQSVPRLARPVTLLIGVSKAKTDGLTWATIAKALRLTHDFLQSEGLGDVECEIRETEDVLAVHGGDANPSDRPFVLPSRNMRRVRQDSTEAAMESIISTCIGNSISPKGQLTREGTLCLFLGPADGTGTVDEPVWALTCNHVAFPPKDDDDDDDEDEDDEENDKDKPPSIVMPANTGLRHAIVAAEKLIANLQKILDGHYGPDDPARVSFDKEKLEWVKATRDKLVALRDSVGDRVIGRVEYAPDIGVNDHPGEPKYTRDWALVKLDRHMFPDGFDFQNVVDLGPPGLPIVSTVNDALDTAIFEAPDFSYMRLSGTIPLSEIRGGKLAHDFVTSKKDDEPRLVLVKDGRTTGKTAGIALDLETYHRTYVGGVEVDSMEWTVVHISLIKYNGSRPLENVFSAAGDSGAAVFDLTGRVGGMLTSGTGLYRLDTTYVTPMEYLLEDIGRQLGSPVRIL